MGTEVERFYILGSDGVTILGPFTQVELEDLARSGGITGETRFARHGEEDWQTMHYTDFWDRIRPKSRHFADELPDIGQKKAVNPDSRRRDLWRLLFYGNLAILASFWLFVGPNVVSLLFLAAGLVMYNVSVVWALFFLMKY